MAENPSRSLTRYESPDDLEFWRPFRELFTPGWRMSRFFDDLVPRAGQAARWTPAVDIGEDDQKYVITAELPGTRKEDVRVEVHENVLTLSGEKRCEREEQKKEEKEQSRWVERCYGSFSRSFALPANVAADKVSASFQEGVLTIELPKAESAKPRQISVH